MTFSISNKYNKYLPFLLIFAVYFAGLFMDVLDIDEAQYATMARQMFDTNSWLQIFDRNDNYLDKPPLVFWLSAISYKILGVSAFAYRLPSFLASILGIYSTFRFAKIYYSHKTAYVASLLLASTEAYFLFNHDVRTDNLLTNCVITSLWQIAEFIEKRKFHNLILGFIFIGLSMLSKGMLGLMIPGLAFSTHFILKRDWKQFLRWEWIIGIIITGIVLFPMCLGLYNQYGTKGLRFFFWTQSFGRLTGESSWDNNPDPFFLYHTFLWAFLPWSLFFLAALFYKLKKIILQKVKLALNEEAITIGGFILPFIALSTSHYQLNHYIYVVFPVASIITATFLVNKILIFENNIKSFWIYIQGFINLVLFAIGFLFISIIFPCQNIFIWIWYLLLSGFSIYLFFNKYRFNKLIISSVVAMAGINFIINIYVYPYLFNNFQSESLAAKYIQTLSETDKNNFFWYKEYMPSLDFYSFKIVPCLNLPEFNNFKPGNYFIYTNQVGKDEIQNLSTSVSIIKEYNHFHISTLSPDFLNPNTRLAQTEKRYLIKISK